MKKNLKSIISIICTASMFFTSTSFSKGIVDKDIDVMHGLSAEENFNTFTGGTGNDSGLSVSDFNYNFTNFTTVNEGVEVSLASPKGVFGKAQDDTSAKLTLSGPAVSRATNPNVYDKPYFVMVPQKSELMKVEEGAQKLSFDFAFDKNCSYIASTAFFYTTEYTGFEDISDYSQTIKGNLGKYAANETSFMFIEKSQVMLFGKTYKLPFTISAEEWYDAELVVFPDNTFSFYIDSNVVVANEPMTNFRVRYQYKNTSDSNVNVNSENHSTYFRGFEQLWMQYYAMDGTDADFEQGYYLDNIRIESMDEPENVVYSDNFNAFEDAEYNADNAFKNNTTADVKFVANNGYMLVHDDAGNLSKAAGDMYFALGNADEMSSQAKPYLSISPKQSMQTTANGSNIISFDFATDSLTRVRIGGYAYYSTKSNPQDVVLGKLNIAGYDGFATFIDMKQDKFKAFGKEYTYPAYVQCGKWHSAIIILNGDNTFSIYIDNFPVVEDEPMESLLIKDVTEEVYFRGMGSVWLHNYSIKSDGVYPTQWVYYDNISLGTTRSEKYVYSASSKIFNMDFEAVTEDGYNGNYSDMYPDVDNWVSAMGQKENQLVELKVEEGGFTDNTSKYFTVKELEGNTVCGSSYLNIYANRFKGSYSGKKGSVILKMKYALPENATSDTYLNVQSYVSLQKPFIDGENTITSGKYRTSTSSENLIEIYKDKINVFGNGIKLLGSVATGQWHTFELVANCDNTFSVYVDDIAYAIKIPFNGFRLKYNSSEGSKEIADASEYGFGGFANLMIGMYAMGKGVQRQVFIDDVALSATYGKASELNQGGVDITYLEAAKESLNILTNHVENGLALDSWAIYDTTVSWKSSDTSIIDDYGRVYPDGEPHTVTMTATLTRNGLSVTKDFVIEVPAVKKYVAEAVKITGEDGIVDTALVGGKTVSAVSLKRFSGSTADVTVVTALYENDVLIGVEINTVGTENLPEQYTSKDIELENKLTLPEDVSACELKVMVFDSINGMCPQADVLEVNPFISEGVSVYMLGDSTMCNYSSQARWPRVGWGQVFGEYYDTATVDNSQSESGRSAKMSILENRLENVLRKVKPGDYVIIQFGHNDAKKESPRGDVTNNYDGSLINAFASVGIEGYSTYSPYDSFAKYLEIFVDEVRDKGATAILATPTATYNTALEARDSGGYGQDMRNFVSVKNVPFIDFTPVMADYMKYLESKGIDARSAFMILDPYNDTRFGEQAISSEWKNGINKNAGEEYYGYYVDTVHLNIHGARAVAGLFAQELIKAGSPLSRFMSDGISDMTFDILPFEYVDKN